MRRVQLVGIKGEAGFEALRKWVNRAIQSLRQDPRIDEITQVERITNMGVNSIPALVVNEQVIYEFSGQPTDYNQVHGLMQAYLENQKKQPMRILVPIDFSDNATNACRFALELAKAQEGEVTLLHVNQPNIDTAGGVVVPTMVDFERIKREQLDDYAGKLKEIISDIDHVPIRKAMLIGFPTDEIIDQSAEYDLIVMGTTGQGGFLEKLFGSVSTKVAQDSKCPVWLIPPNAEYATVDDLAYACSYPEKDQEIFDQVEGWFPATQTRYHLVHVATDDDEPVEAVLDQWNSTFGELAYQTTNIRSESIWEGIYTYADIEEIDLIVLVTKRRNFWNSLTHASKTKEMVLHARKPLLVFHVG